jgi:hypothetical protein
MARTDVGQAGIVQVVQWLRLGTAEQLDPDPASDDGARQPPALQRGHVVDVVHHPRRVHGRAGAKGKEKPSGARGVDRPSVLPVRLESAQPDAADKTDRVR